MYFSWIHITRVILDQTWLGVRCHPEWEFRPLLFSHSWTIQGPESTCWSGNCRCFTEIWPKVYMTYAWFFPDFEKSSVLHIFAHWVVKFLAIPIYLISTGTGFHVDVTYFLSDICKMHKRAFSWYFNPNFTDFSYFHTSHTVNSQNTFLLADFCMVYMFSFDSNMF